MLLLRLTTNSSKLSRVCLVMSARLPIQNLYFASGHYAAANGYKLLFTSGFHAIQRGPRNLSEICHEGGRERSLGMRLEEKLWLNGCENRLL